MFTEEIVDDAENNTAVASAGSKISVQVSQTSKVSSSLGLSARFQSKVKK